MMDMLSPRTGLAYQAQGEDSAPVSLSALIDELTGFIRRQYKVFLVVPAAAIAIGLLYLLITPAQYTATATLLIDSSTLRVLQNQLQPQGDIPLDTLQVGSQVEVLASQRLARAVVKKLNLADDPEFIGTTGFLWSSPAPSSEAEREHRAIGEFLSHRSIARIERTYALNISYTSRNPVIAAKVANAIAEAYIDDQLDAKYQTINRASAWLQDRITELKAKVTAADRAVLEFKEKNNIVDFGGSNGASGGASSRLMGEQQLLELNSQLATARGATSEAKARLDRIEQVRKMNVGEAAVADSLKNEVITRLRNQYLDLSAREANISAKYGRDHAAAVNLRGQMEELARNLGAELGRIGASYRSDYEIAKTREENLERALATLVSEGQVTNRDRLGLAELESSAKIYHGIYDTFLQRYMEAIQQQSFPITDARVIGSAAPPSKKSKPVSTLVLVIAGAMGFIVSLGIAGFREVTDGAFRTARQTEQALQARCISVIPLAPTGTMLAPSPAFSRSVPEGTDPGAEPPQHAHEAAALDTPSYEFTDPIKRRVTDDPLSGFTEAFRAIKVNAWLRAGVQTNQVIGVTSTLPNEGKSTVACNLAALMAGSGKRVVLIDVDLRNPTLGRSLGPAPTVGWMEVLSGKIDLAQALGEERTTKLAVLPLVLDEKPVHFDEILLSRAFGELVHQLRQRYDYVIMDLPPIAPVVDVRAIMPLVDSLVFVVEWGSTRIKAVRNHLMAAPEIHNRLLGIVLNKANLKVIERFEQHGVSSNGYYVDRGYRIT